jgi:uncharacterized protein (DUF2141 family)
VDLRGLMNEGSEVSSSLHGREPGVRIPKGFRFVWFALLMFVNLSAIAFAQTPCPGIHVRILNIRNNTGTIACALFESPVGFPTQFLHSAMKVMVMKIQKTEARCDFEDMSRGTYAIAAIHDENSNGRLDANWMSIPTEGYGFSNDAKGVVGAPSFSAASFPYDRQNLDLTLTLHY